MAHASQLKHAADPVHDVAPDPKYTDTPAARFLVLLIVGLLALCTLIFVVIFARTHAANGSDDVPEPPSSQVDHMRTPTLA